MARSTPRAKHCPYTIDAFDSLIVCPLMRVLRRDLDALAVKKMKKVRRAERKVLARVKLPKSIPTVRVQDAMSL